MCETCSGPRAASVASFTPLPSALNPLRLTRAARPGYWKTFDQTRQRWLRPMSRLVGKQFMVEGKKVEAAVAQAGEPGHAILIAEAAVTKLAPLWKPVYEDIYVTVGGDFARRVARGLKDGGLTFEMKGIEDRWSKTVRSYIRNQSSTKIKRVTQTTKANIRRVLEAGIAEGEGMDKLGKRISSLYESFSTMRSVMIARTETIAASNCGSQAGALSTGLTLEKFWIATPDDRTRDWHTEAGEGEPIPMADPYVVDGEELMFPGDISLDASGSNVINCRCTEGYNPLDD